MIDLDAIFKMILGIEPSVLLQQIEHKVILIENLQIANYILKIFLSATDEERQYLYCKIRDLESIVGIIAINFPEHFQIFEQEGELAVMWLNQNLTQLQTFLHVTEEMQRQELTTNVCYN